MDSRFIEEATKAVEDKAKEIFGDGVIVEVREVVKINDEILHGITIQEGELSMIPTIYLENYERAYLEGKPLSEIAGEIIREHKREINEIPEILDLSLEYKDIKNKLVVQYVEIARNRDKLQNVIHRPLENGFAMMAYIVLDENVRGTMKTAVTREIARDYGYDLVRVLDKAYENTVKRYKPVLMDLQDMVMHFGENVNGVNPYDKDARIESQLDVFILTNNCQMNGAGALFYPQMQKRIGEILNSDYYVLPSSVHEVMIVPDKGQVSLKELKDMVKSINRTIVEPQEVLSDRVFRYDRERQRLFEPKNRQKKREERSER